jgi:molybdopterin biosynthesis enzyme MoaB
MSRRSVAIVPAEDNGRVDAASTCGPVHPGGGTRLSRRDLTVEAVTPLAA